MILWSVFVIFYIINRELNDLRIINCLTKSEVTVEKVSVFSLIERFASIAYSVCHAPIPMTS